MCEERSEFTSASFSSGCVRVYPGGRGGYPGGGVTVGGGAREGPSTEGDGIVAEAAETSVECVIGVDERDVVERVTSAVTPRKVRLA